MAGLVPMWSNDDLDRTFKAMDEDTVKRSILALQYVGERFVGRARRKNWHSGSFKDQTGNLRSSISYVVLVDGKVVNEYAGQKKVEAVMANNQLIDELAPQFSKGIVLICMAGMGYAAYVESRGYDVITGSTPTDRQIGATLKTLLS